MVLRWSIRISLRFNRPLPAFLLRRGKPKSSGSRGHKGSGLQPRAKAKPWASRCTRWARKVYKGCLGFCKMLFDRVLRVTFRLPTNHQTTGLDATIQRPDFLGSFNTLTGGCVLVTQIFQRERDGVPIAGYTAPV